MKQYKTLACLFVFIVLGKVCNAQKLLIGYELQENAFATTSFHKQLSPSGNYDYANKISYLKQNITVQYFNKQKRFLSVGFGYNSAGHANYWVFNDQKKTRITFNESKATNTNVNIGVGAVYSNNRFMVSYGLQLRNLITSNNTTNHYRHTAMDSTAQVLGVIVSKSPNSLTSSLGFNVNANYRLVKQLYMGCGFYLGPQLYRSKGDGVQTEYTYPGEVIKSRASAPINSRTLSLVYQPFINLSYLIK
jgi:hypothetical protein